MRRPLALTLVLAFLLALFAPAQASWACPDGTPCVQGRRRAGEPNTSFACAGGQCSSKPSCCLGEAKPASRCKHGTHPGEDHGTGGPAIGSGDHCRFTVTAHSHAAALFDGSAKSWVPDLLAFYVPFQWDWTPEAGAPVWRTEYTLGYRPPPSLTVGPARAPPSC